MNVGFEGVQGQELLELEVVNPIFLVNRKIMASSDIDWIDVLRKQSHKQLLIVIENSRNFLNAFTQQRVSDHLEFRLVSVI